MRRKVQRFTILTLGILGVLAGAATTATAFDPYETAHGVVEAVPERSSPPAGLWMIAGRVVRVDATTRIHPPADVPSGEYWIQTSTGVVVRAPGWTPEQAHAAGFRAASAQEAAAKIAVGRTVRAKLQPGHDEPLLASEILILPAAGQAEPRPTARVGRPLGAE